MLNKTNIGHIWRSLCVAIVVIFGVFLININYAPVALAGDNYNAATDTYQETRNPNRVSTTTDELAKSNMNQQQEAQGESIYDRLVEKVDNRRNEALGKNNNKLASQK